MKDAEDVAKKLTEIIAKKADTFWRDKKVREMINFSAKDQEENDRIFNEIVVTGQVLVILTAESVSDLAQGYNKKTYFKELAMEMTSHYSNWLAELGVEDEFTQMWKQLVGLRKAEYQKDYKDNKKHFKGMIEMMVWPHVTAIGGYRHITRGRGKPEGPLFQLFLDWIKDISRTMLKQFR